VLDQSEAEAAGGLIQRRRNAARSTPKCSRSNAATSANGMPDNGRSAGSAGPGSPTPHIRRLR
jgi:hypothetical protein